MKDVHCLYDIFAAAYDKDRSRSLMERAYLKIEKLRTLAQPGRNLLTRFTVTSCFTQVSVQLNINDFSTPMVLTF